MFIIDATIFLRAIIVLQTKSRVLLSNVAIALYVIAIFLLNLMTFLSNIPIMLSNVVMILYAIATILLNLMMFLSSRRIALWKIAIVAILLGSESKVSEERAIATMAG
jgi:hypothetical protein